MVVLVEPAGPLNVGRVARLCANFGVQSLRLVNPQCDHRSDEAQRMAVHGRDLLDHATVHRSLLNALSGCRRAVATCGRIDHGDIPLLTSDQALSWLLSSGDDPAAESQPVAVVFGREDRGLSNSELRLCQRVLSLHSDAAYPSLNLSHAVAVVLHEMNRLQRHAMVSQPTGPDPAPASALSDFLNDAESLLLEVGYLLPHTASARMAKVNDLLQRATTGREEVALLRGMVRQLRWAVRARRP